MKTSTKSLLAVATVAVFTIASAGASVIVSFGGDYVTTNTGGSRSWGADGSDYTVAFSNSSALNPSSGYTGPTYYGAAYRGSWTVTTGGNTNVVNNADGTNDAIQLDNGTGTSAVDTGYAGLIFFNKANFLNGGDSNAVNISSNSSFTARGTNAQNTGVLEVRWVLQQTDASYIISAASISTFGNNNSYTTISSGDLTTLNWFNYNPSTSIIGIGTSATADFTDIKAVGVYFADTINSANSRYQGRLSSFGADVTVIPEPTTWALLAGSLTALMVFRRRRNS